MFFIGLCYKRTFGVDRSNCFFSTTMRLIAAYSKCWFDERTFLIL